MKYKDWFVECIENIVKQMVKIRANGRYSELINGHINPKIEEYEINDLTPLILQKLVTDLLQCGNLITGK